LVLAIALGQLALHLATNGHYGIFRDELYYLACADHLDWGYVDHPPLSIAALWAVRALLGDSVHAIRILPALAGGLLVVLSAVMTRRLGGGRFAEALAALSVAVAPEYLGITGFFSMNAFDLLFWALAMLIVIRIVETDDPRLWLLFGGVVGLGLLNKISVLFFCFGLGVALPFTRLRRHLKSRYLWLGAVLAFAIFGPHLVWQARHDWPTLEFIRNAQQYKLAPIGPSEFFLAQLLNLHPLNAPIWLAGLGYLLLTREARRFRILGLTYLVVFAYLASQGAKPYYLAPAYPMLLAAGAIAIERVLEGRSWRWPRLALPGVLAASGLALAPFAVPLLPVDTFIRYQNTLGVKPASGERSHLGPLPQHFADRFGWEEMTAAVASVYHALSAEERAGAVIVTSNYGEASAINYYGSRHGLPRAVSQHNNYYLWGPGTVDSHTAVIVVGMPSEDLVEAFETVTPAGRMDSPYAMPYETRNPIHVCRGLRITLEEAWRAGKQYI
jgi:hypothetical protein